MLGSSPCREGQRPLIYTADQGFIDLLLASQAWQRIARELVRGKTVAEAVTAWNDTQPLPARQYRYEGNGNIKIAISRAP